MKQFSLLQQHILESLADGHCHSGSALGERSAVSRTAIWKHIKQLMDLGAPITCLPQQGYQLTRPFIALNEATVLQALAATSMMPPCRVHLFSELDSTNKFLKNMGKSDYIEVCLTEKQTQGRGRFGRTWVSPFGDNLYVSSRWKLDCCVSKLSGLSLVVSLAIFDSLQTILDGHDIRIKWPNDLLWQTKKLCGVLIEIVAEPNACTEVIIGIGLNVNEHMLADASWCSLHTITGRHFDRNLLVAQVLTSLDRYIQEFLAHDFAWFQSRWQKVDYLQGQYITTVQSGNTLSGYATGVTDQGQLCLLDDAGKEWILSSGDTSLQRGL